MKSVKKKTGRFLSMLVTVCMCIMMLAVPVFADNESEAVSAARSGVVQINLAYKDAQGNAHAIQGGSGFLIGDQVVLTNNHVVTMDDETKALAGEAFGVDFNNSSTKTEIQVVVTRDVVYTATIRANSAEMDLAVLDLSAPIGDRSVLNLADSSEVSEAQPVYALGFPGSSQLAQDFQYYTSDDVTVTNGIVSKLTSLNGVATIQHSAKVTGGNSGGPLVNQDGNVIGMNAFTSEDQEYYYAITVNEIKDLLDKLNVPYNTAGGTTPAVTEEPTQTPEGTSTPGTETDSVVPEEETVDKAELNAKIGEANAYNASDYTTESFGLLETKLEDANAVAANENATQAEVDNAAASLQSAISSLEEKSGMDVMTIVLIAVIAVLVIVVIVVVVVMMNSSKKKANTYVTKGGGGSKGYSNVGGGHQGPNSGGPRPSVPPTQNNYGSSETETGVLNEGSSDTTVLGSNGGQSAGVAYLIRKKTGERVAVRGNSFRIGKERGKVDYCISDNTSISRCHAQIVRKGSDYYIVDMNSTNYTFVDGVKAVPNQETHLKNHAAVRMADEDFEFILP